MACRIDFGGIGRAVDLGGDALPPRGLQALLGITGPLATAPGRKSRHACRQGAAS